MFERKRQFTPKQEPPKVKREEWDTPSGMHAVSIELSVNSPEAAAAVSVLIKTAEELRGKKNVDDIAGHVSWCGGYIAALVTTKSITPEQADTLQELVEKIAASTVHGMGYVLKMGKRGR